MCLKCLENRFTSIEGDLAHAIEVNLDVPSSSGNHSCATCRSGLWNQHTNGESSMATKTESTIYGACDEKNGVLRMVFSDFFLGCAM